MVVANPRYRNADPEAVGDVLAQDGDVVVVAEPGPVGARAGGTYPHAVTAYETGGRGAVIVVSRFPLRAGQRARQPHRQRRVPLRGAGARRPVVLYAAHPDPPGLGGSHLSPVEQDRLFDRLAHVAHDEILPVVVAGDLNLVDRSSTFRRLTDHLDDATGHHLARPHLAAVALPAGPHRPRARRPGLVRRRVGRLRDHRVRPPRRDGRGRSVRARPLSFPRHVNALSARGPP